MGHVNKRNAIVPTFNTSLNELYFIRAGHMLGYYPPIELTLFEALIINIFNRTLFLNANNQ